MRNLLQIDRLADVGPVLHDAHDPAVIELEKRPQHHQREELVLGEILAAEPAGVGRERTRRDLDGLPGQRHRRPRDRSGGIHSGCIVTIDA
jgi:hypothetical protein